MGFKKSISGIDLFRKNISYDIFESYGQYKMRLIIYILTFLIFVSCTNNNKQKDSNIKPKSEAKTFEKSSIRIDTVQIDKYSNELDVWLNYYKQNLIKLKSFEFIKQEKLPNITAKIDILNYRDDIYEPYYKYSTDSSKILDLISYNLPLEKNEQNELVSYGGDVDSEVSIKDLKNGVWKRVLFVGSFYIIEDGFWINNDQILIVGEYNDTDEIKSKPLIWFVDLKTNTIQTFEYKNYIDKMKCDYLEKIRYKDIKIIE